MFAVNTMTLRGSKAVVLTIAAIAVLALVVVLEITDSSAFYAWQQNRMVRRVLAAGRQLLDSRAGFVGEISPSAHEIPPAIRRLKPTRVSISTNSVWVDFSDAFNPFGIAVYATGVDGRGPHKWIDGLWLYDDGQLEGIGQTVARTGAPPSNSDPH